MNRDESIDELMRVHLQLKRHMRQMVSSKLNDGLSITQIEFLRAIQSGNTILRDIAVQSLMTPSAATQQLKVLEGQSLVERSVSKEDKRQYEIQLTQKGKDYVDRYHATSRRYLSEYLEVLSDSELDEFISLMNKMIQQK